MLQVAQVWRGLRGHEVQYASNSSALVGPFQLFNLNDYLLKQVAMSVDEPIFHVSQCG